MVQNTENQHLKMADIQHLFRVCRIPSHMWAAQPAYIRKNGQTEGRKFYDSRRLDMLQRSR